eukprot:XP_025013162.1 uncharacterized protein LOC8278897 [Ricinus communis]
MWGFGGRCYWGRKERKREGIVVVFAWMSSQERHVKPYVELYSSLGWNSLVCHSQFLNMFFSEKAETLALDILNEIIEELKMRPCPLVFASFSGGPKACMYKVIQVGYLILLWRFQLWNFYWYHSEFISPYSLHLVNCCLGHFRQYPVDYKAAVTELLGKASTVYSQRIRRLEGEGMSVEGGHDEISEPMSDLRKAAASPSQSFRGVTIQPSDHFYMPSSVGYYEGRDGGSLQDEQKEGLIHLPSPPKINAHGVLGQILFDVCVPKNVEDWDIRSSTSLSRQPYTSMRRHAPFNPIKCIRRSRL